MRFVTTENVTRRPSSLATMANVFPSCGTVTLMTIVEMTVTNLPISVVRGTVQKVGEDVPVTTITDVSLNGSSAMAKMTAEMARMNCPRTVQFVRTRESSSAGTRDVSPRGGCVTLRTTAETIATRTRTCATVGTGTAPSPSSSVTTTSVSRPDGSVTWTMTAAMAVTRNSVSPIHVRRVSSSVTLVIVSRRNCDVTETGTVEISRMNLDVLHASLMVLTVPKINTSVTTISV